MTPTLAASVFAAVREVLSTRIDANISLEELRFRVAQTLRVRGLTLRATGEVIGVSGERTRQILRRGERREGLRRRRAVTRATMKSHDELLNARCITVLELPPTFPFHGTVGDLCSMTEDEVYNTAQGLSHHKRKALEKTKISLAALGLSLKAGSECHCGRKE